VTMAVAVALAEAVAEATGVDARLKWPNDLVVGDDHDPLGCAVAGQPERVAVGRPGLGAPAHVREPGAGQRRPYPGRPGSAIWHRHPPSP